MHAIALPDRPRAIATLAITPSSARQTLESISERNEYPQAAYARDMLHAIDTGSIVPA